MTQTTRFFLGLDGGGSGCRAVLADAQGVVLGRGTGGPANVNSDREGALAAIDAACAQAMGDRPAAQVTAVLGLAGAEVSRAREWLTPRLAFAQVRVVQDAVTATAGALGSDDGIVAAIGTGSVFSRQIGGQVTVIGGRGPILGDEAGGAWLGRRLLARTLRAVDGVDPQTPLTQATLAKWGDVAGIIGFAATARAADFGAHLADLLAMPDDPVAQDIMGDADAQITRYISALQPAEALPVVFTGGLGAIFQARLSDRWQIAPAKGSSLDGALILARAMPTPEACL